MGKGQKSMVGARVPHTWKDQIQGISQQTGKSESEVVQEAIVQYLGRTDLNSVESLMKRVAALEQQLKKLAQLVTSQITMSQMDFSQQIEYLLFTGAIRGDAILRLHHLLKSCEQRMVSAEEMQKTINDLNPDLYVELPSDEV